MVVQRGVSVRANVMETQLVRRLEMMDEKKLKDISLYHATMKMFRSLLERGVITDEEYRVIDTKMAEKYGIKMSVIYR